MISPSRFVAVAVAIAGSAIVAMNRDAPDESLAIGAVAILVGVAAFANETRRRAAALEMTAVTLLVLAGGEIVARRENALAAQRFADHLVRFVSDPVLRYEMKPSTGCGHGNTNALGMLDGPRAVENASGAVRIACLGDSVGGDCELPQGNACAALERALGSGHEVLNFSVPGYNALQEARALELKAAPFVPDAVVVLYVLNDAYPDLAVSHFLPGHFVFEHLLFNGSRSALARALPSLDPMAAMFASQHESERGWRVVVEAFDRIRDAAAGRPVVIAVFPVFVARPSGAYARITEKVTREARAHGFSAIDLAKDAFAGEPVAALLKASRDPIHPNAHAHDLAARAIARELGPRLAR
jgi:hypothetical protein